MEQRGTLQSWNDDKGFGFILPEQGGDRLFVHISAMRGDRRPSQGDKVLYVAGRDEQGRLRAEHMRAEGLALDRPAIRKKPRAPAPPTRPSRADRPRRQPLRAAQGIRNPGLKLLIFALLLALPTLGSVQLLSNGSGWVLMAYLLISVLCFLLYWSDKHKASKGRWRTSESTLHAAELLGGWPGALVAQQVFRHKTRKVSYQSTFWLIVAAHQVFWVDWLLLDGRYLGHLLVRALG
ncbi:cold-shock protein [Pseudomonas sp. WN033]|nr:cold-shock protein [Pseudomonas sp. WN033]